MKNQVLFVVLPFFVSLFIILLLFIPMFPGNTMNWDNNPTMLTPIVLVKHKTFFFDPLQIGRQKLDKFGTKADTAYYFFVTKDRRVISSYPIFNGILLTPVYALVSLFRPQIWDIQSFPNVILARIGFILSVMITVLTSYILHLIISFRTRSSMIGLFGAFIFIFCTSVLSVSSRFLWQHTFSLLFISAMLLANQRKKYFFVLLFSVLAVVCRPTTLFICLPFLIFAGFQAYRDRLRFKILFWDYFALLITVVIIITQAYYSKTYLNNLVAFSPAYDILQISQYNPARFSGNILKGVSGVIFSPGAGIFFYSPIFFIAAIHLVTNVKNGSHKDYPRFFLSLLFFVLITGKWRSWYGGWSLGYRLMLETVPIFTIIFCDFFSQHKLKANLSSLVVVSALVGSYLFNTQITANFGECGFHGTPSNIDSLDLRGRDRRLWFDSPIIRCIKKLHNDGDIYSF